MENGKFRVASLRIDNFACGLQATAIQIGCGCPAHNFPLSTFNFQLQKRQCPVFSQYAVSGQTEIGSVKYLRQHRMIHADCRASAVDYAALP